MGVMNFNFPHTPNDVSKRKQKTLKQIKEIKSNYSVAKFKLLFLCGYGGIVFKVSLFTASQKSI